MCISFRGSALHCIDKYTLCANQSVNQLKALNIHFYRKCGEWDLMLNLCICLVSCSGVAVQTFKWTTSSMGSIILIKHLYCNQNCINRKILLVKNDDIFDFSDIFKCNKTYEFHRQIVGLHIQVRVKRCCHKLVYNIYVLVNHLLSIVLLRCR